MTRENDLDPIPEGTIAECDRCDTRFFDLPSFRSHWNDHHGAGEPSYRPVGKHDG